MLEFFNERFLQALHTAARMQLGAEHSCTKAVALAAASCAQADIEEAQKQLFTLSAEMNTALMEAVHKEMRADPAALLQHWTPPGGGTRPH